MPINKKKLKKLDKLFTDLEDAAQHMAGYPENQIFDYSPLLRFMKFSINNVGDPFEQSSTYRINTHDFEKEVINAFARFFHAPNNGYWGYVTNGGSEGNLFGLYLARECYPKGTVYFSEETHYSILKNVQLLRMPFQMIKSLQNGEIDYKALEITLKKNKEKNPIIIANIGSTMKGSVDNVNQIRRIFAKLNIKHSYIHCDAALFGMLLPFLPQKKSQAFDFRAKIDSLAISGHKMIGMPIPCGVTLVKKFYSEKIAKNIEYTGTLDNTISGSRNGITPLFLWYEMVLKQDKKRLRKNAIQSIEKAKYAIQQFQKVGIQAWRNENSNIVIFPRPSEDTRNKWQLAVEGDIAHMITLPQVTYQIINLIVDDVHHDLKSNPSLLNLKVRKKRN